MNTAKRFIAMLMLIIMLSATVTEPLSLTVYAGGPQVPTLGSTDVADAPEELLYLGEWQYFVVDDTAIIAGYTNYGETALKIPYSLGGYPVTGIAHKAFSPNAALQEIEIHTNVTAIAADAFEGCENVIIAAYHGAFALSFAVQAGLESNNLSDFAEFVDDVIDLTGLDSKAYYALTDNSVVFKAKQAGFLNIGQVLFFPVQSGYETGLARRVESIRETGTGIFVTLSAIAFGEVFESVAFDTDLYLDWDNAVFPEDITVVEDDVNSEGLIHSEYEPSIGYKELKKELGLEIKINSSTKIKVNLTAKTTASLRGKLIRDGLKFKWESGHAEFNIENGLSLEVGWKDKRAELENGGQPLTWNLTPKGSTRNWTNMFEVPFFSTGILSGYITFEIICDIDGSVKISFVNYRTIKYDVQNGSWKKTYDQSTPGQHSLELSGSLKTGPQLGIEIRIGIAKVAEITFVKATVGIFYKVTGKTTFTQTLGTGPVHCCIDVDQKILFELEFKIGFVKVKSFIGSIETKACLSYKYDPSISLPGFHIDISKGSFSTSYKSGECDLKNRNTTFYADKNSNSSKSKTQDVNKGIQVPSISRDGYKFDGWYFDAKKSGVSGEDYKIIPDSSRMPYIGHSGTAYFYATWIDLYPPKSFTLNKSSYNGYSNIGTTVKLKPDTWNPVKTNNKSVTWSSSDPKVASVSSDGTVTLKNAGTATITATSVANPKAKATCTITVRQSVTGITLDKSSITKYSDELCSVQLNATVKPGNAYDSTVVWTSSNSSVATVDSNGYVTLVGPGKADIKCSSKTNPKVYDVYKVTVLQAVTGLTLDKSTLYLTTADMSPVKLKANIAPSNAHDKSVTWTCSDTSVATVSQDGTVTPVSFGTATITCTSVNRPQFSATCQVRIVKAVTDITLNEKSVTKYSDEKNIIQLTADVKPDDADVKTVHWTSSDTNVVQVDDNGAVTVKAAGTAVVTCSSESNPEVTAKCTFNILQAVTSVTLNRTSISCEDDEVNVFYLTAAVAPANAYNRSVIWESSDENVAAVTQNGIVSIVGHGTAVIRCKSVSNPYIYGECTVSVEQSVRSMSLNKSNLICYSNNTAGIQLIANIQGSAAANRSVTWVSSDPNVAQIGNDGIVYIKSVGECVITATSTVNTSVSASCNVRVLQSVTDIALDKNTLISNTKQLDPVQLIASVTPANAADSTLIWSSSNEAVAVVSQSGKVEFVGPGSCTITCTSASDPEIKDTCSVEVQQNVTGVRINYSSIETYTDLAQDISLVSYCTPSYAYNTDVVWSSSDTSVATVSESGKLHIVGAGSAVIRCTSVSNYDATAECIVTVKQAINSIALDKSKVSVFSNSDDVVLNATIAPAAADAANIIWTSTDSNVVSVSENGVVSVNGLGAAYIRATSITNPDIYAECRFDVHKQVNSIILNSYSVTCYSDIGYLTQLTANVQPVEAENKDVIWSSSNSSVAQISEDGSVTVTGVGKAVISCTSVSNPEVEAHITVTAKQGMTSVALDKQELEVYRDEDGVQLNATIAPSNTDDSALIWESSNMTVAVVDDNGYVTPVTPGTAVISCRSARRPDAVYSECTVTVLQKIEGIEIESIASSILPGEKVTLQANVYPQTANNTAVTWSTSDKTVATVSSTGVVTGRNYGTAVITATAADGSGAEGSYEITVEHELSLETVVDNDTLYVFGTEPVTIASVFASNESVRRMSENGSELVWTLSNADSNEEVTLSTQTTTVEAKGEEYQSTYAVLASGSFTSAGSRSYTITCTAGDYSVSETINVEVLDGEFANTVLVRPSSFYIDIGEAAEIPNIPISSDSKPLPEDITLTAIAGDDFFASHANVTFDSENASITFDESGIFTAEAIYSCANIRYIVNLTFYVADENGIIHKKLETIELNTNSIDIVEGGTFKLEAAITPDDAYDSSVTWQSGDPNVATVDENGVVTAVSHGSTFITCISNDGSNAYDGCAVEVQKYVQLSDNEITLTAYTGGSDHAELGIVSVAYLSQKRIYEAGQNVTWNLEKLNGSACEIGIEEFGALAEEGITVYGDIIKLMRINSAGTSDYLLTCKAGDYSDTCIIHINIVEADLPNRIVVATSSYSGTVGENISIDTSYVGGSLPEDTEVRLSYGHAFENALSEDYDSFDAMNLIFARGGSFTAELVYSGGNYSYTCPIAITVSNEDGTVPATITDVNISKQFVYLAVGEEETVIGSIEPTNAPHSAGVWSTTDSSVASVSANGTITAISAGEAYIKYSVPESDIVAGCYVVVEDGLTLEEDSIERTVYLDGITRTVLDHVSLTSGSSIRAEEEPVWTLARVSGNNLTLKVRDYGSYDSDGNYIYGCAIELYSLSRVGDTVYELTCTNGDDSVTIPVRVHAVERASELPSGIMISKNTFTATPNQLISFVPNRICLPIGTELPDGIRVTIEGDKVFNESLNAEDYSVSQSQITLSFSRAGLFEANLVYSYSNVRYVVPVTFKVKDENGNVPILPSSVELSSKSLWLTTGETAELSAIFTPANADNCAVTWISDDESVATVDANGNVTAISNGRADIICVPSDPYLTSKVCSVWVEDYLALETAPVYVSLYKQGEQKNEVFSALLTTGTIQRLDKEGITPEWSFSRVSGSNANVSTFTSANGDTFIVNSESLNTAGIDVYRVTCKAGEYTKTMDVSLTVIDSVSAPESVAPAQAKVSANVGETFTVDFTPVCYPGGTSIPDTPDMFSGYAGIGEGFVEACDYSVYSTDGDTATLRFTKPGKYLMSRYYLANNLLYSAVCEITVGNTEGSYGLISSDTTDVTVYVGGSTGTLANLSILDTIVYSIFNNNISWTAERISGSSLKAVVKETATGAEFNVSGINGIGTDVWRITCSMGSFTESVDIKVDVREARKAIPESVALSVNSISGMMGDWLSMPIAESCAPVGSALPESGDSFWSFEPLGMAADVSKSKVEDGLLKVLFMYPGYYSGVLHYTAGNFKYDFPVYINVTDEEGVLNAPMLAMNLIGTAATVYSGGATGVAIGTAAVSRGSGEYYMGEGASYMNSNSGEWSITVDSGTAAKLSIKPTENNLAQIVLDSVSGTGIIGYTVSCTVNGVTYSESAELTVTDSKDNSIDPTLGRRVYYVRPGELLTVDTTVYDRNSGSILQSATAWNPGNLLEVVGNDYTETDTSLQLAFYEEGTFESSVTAVVGNQAYSIPFTVVVSRTADSGAKLLKLPAALTSIEAYAFEKCSAEIADLRGTAAASIGQGAFNGCTDLKLVFIPASVTSIADTAFYGCINLTIVCDRGSAADAFAAAHSIPVCYN